MNRFFSLFNFAGVAVLCVLCCVQWNANSRLEDNVEQLDQTRIEQSAKIVEQDRTLKDDAADLEDLRQRLSMSESELKTTMVERDRFAAEDKQLKAALDKWIAAVKERDAAIKQAGDLIQKLAAERNDAIGKFNDLVDKYNALVKQ
jgi:septal ring factor EnvC (AmiA/AmiB activator)